MSGEAVIKYLVCYYLGVLPFVHVYHDVLSIPYMTRDYLRMKLIEGREKSWLYYPFIVLTVLSNCSINPMIEHLNKRGVFTNYWVINDDDEMRRVMRTTKVQGIMSDRPTALRNLIAEEVERKEAKKHEVNVIRA